MSDGEPVLSAAYGLIWAAPAPLPGAMPAHPGAEVDVTLTLGALPPARPGRVIGPFWRLCEDGSAWYSRDGLHAVVEDGRRAILDPPRDWDAGRVALEAAYALPPALLHQRRLMPFHAAALACEAGAVLIVGEAGQGKSTLASALAETGWRPAADDVAAVADAPVPAVHRGLATAKLFADSAAAARGAGGGDLLGAGRGLGKAVVSLPGSGGDADWPAPLRAMLFLEWSLPAEAAPRLEALAPMAALPRLGAAVLRREFTLYSGLEGVYLGRLARIVAAAPAFALVRPRRWSALPETLARVREAVDLGAARAAGQGREP